MVESSGITGGGPRSLGGGPPAVVGVLGILPVIRSSSIYPSKLPSVRVQSEVLSYRVVIPAVPVPTV